MRTTLNLCVQSEREKKEKSQGRRKRRKEEEGRGGQDKDTKGFSSTILISFSFTIAKSMI
jgi:hypothetical protein